MSDRTATPSRAPQEPDRRPGYTQTLRQLASAQKSGKGAPAYSRFVNRPLGRALAAAAHLAGLTPTAVTAVSAAFSFSGIAVLALLGPSWGVGAAVTGLLVVGYALDAADGQLARLQGGGSLAGEWLDHMVDSLKITSLHVAVAISVHRFMDVDDRWLLVPVGFTIVAVVSFFAQILNEQLRARAALAGGDAAGQPSGRPSIVLSLLKVPTDYGVLCLLFLLLGAPAAFLGVYALMLTASTGYLALAVIKWYRDMRALDAAVAS